MHHDAMICFGTQIDLPLDSSSDFVDLFNEFNDAIELMSVELSDEVRYVMFIKESKINCGTHDQPIIFTPIRMPSLSEAYWIIKLQDACKRFNIQYGLADWQFISYFY